MTAGALRALERLLLPNVCVACDGPVAREAPDELLCSLCRARLRRPGRGCQRCQQPLPPVGPCRFCAEWPNALRRVRSAAWLGPEAREMVHHLKYEGYTALGRPLAELIARAVPRPTDSVLVPVPLGSNRRRERGYNQAAVIARALGTVWGVPVVEPLLRRVRDTRSQTALTPDERRANVTGAFYAAPPPDRGGERGGAAVILVDDVLTTGATLAAAAAALATAGWSEVGAVTFARALPFELRADGTVEHEWLANQGT